MLDTCIDLHQFRIVVNQVQDFFPSEIITPLEAGIDFSHEFEIFRRVHRPAVVAEISGVMEQGNIISARGNTSV